MPKLKKFIVTKTHKGKIGIIDSKIIRKLASNGPYIPKLVKILVKSSSI